MYWERSVSMSLRRVYDESTASLRRHRPQRPSSTATIVYGNSLATMVHGHISWPNAGAHYRLIYWWVTNCDHNSVKSLDEISGPLDALSVWSFCMSCVVQSLYELTGTLLDELSIRPLHWRVSRLHIERGRRGFEFQIRTRPQEAGARQLKALDRPLINRPGFKLNNTCFLFQIFRFSFGFSPRQFHQRYLPASTMSRGHLGEQCSLHTFTELSTVQITRFDSVPVVFSKLEISMNPWIHCSGSFLAVG